MFCRKLRLAFVLTAVLSAIGSAQDRPAPPQIPDPNWRPRVGDRVTVRQPGSAGLPDRASCERYIRFARASDTDGMRELSANRLAIPIDAGTSVLVIEPHGLPRPADGPASSPEELNGDIQDAIHRAASRPRPVVSVEARILDGPHKGKVAFVPADFLARMIAPTASAGLRAGDRIVVTARSVPMGDDHDYLVQFVADPNGGSNREHVLPLPKGTTATVLSAGQWSCRVKVTGRSRLAGKVGFIKGDGVDLVGVDEGKARAKGK